MKLRYFFSLYGRNIKGAFMNSFDAVKKQIDSESINERSAFGPGIIILFHLHTCLVTVPIIATVKTFFDFFTRKLESPEIIKNKSDEIGSAKDEVINALAISMLSYNNACFNSSRKVLDQLTDKDNKSTSKKRELIKSYVAEPKNNGKKLMQNICALFAPDKSSETSTNHYPETFCSLTN